MVLILVILNLKRCYFPDRFRQLLQKADYLFIESIDQHSVNNDPEIDDFFEFFP